MDVNAIGNNISSINVYSTAAKTGTDSDASQNSNTANVTGDNLEVSSNKKIEQSQESDNKNKQENKDGVDKKQLDKAVKKLNKFLEDDKTHAEYSVHKDLGTIMIKIIDDDTHQVILEVPSKKILDMVASMCKEVGLLDKKA